MFRPCITSGNHAYMGAKPIFVIRARSMHVVEKGSVITRVSHCPRNQALEVAANKNRAEAGA